MHVCTALRNKMLMLIFTVKIGVADVNKGSVQNDKNNASTTNPES